RAPADFREHAPALAPQLDRELLAFDFRVQLHKSGRLNPSHSREPDTLLSYDHEVAREPVGVRFEQPPQHFDLVGGALVIEAHENDASVGAAS
ncbi:MAG TPA: hypothetical protein VE642_08680, partial [Pyrinomonadaceae bacterium]|nr:hypothetical protein [Pyrinomonadaceae bacterium]